MKLYQDVLHDQCEKQDGGLPYVVGFGSESVADWELFKNNLSNSLRRSLPSVQVQYKKKLRHTFLF